MTNHDVLQEPSSIIVLSFDHRSFHQLNMSNQSLPALGTDSPFSHKIVVSILHEQNIICSKTIICRPRGELSVSEKEGKNTWNEKNS